MTARRPLITTGGRNRELPAGDYLADPVLAAISQVAGLDGATLLEIEAKYGAARMTLRSNDGGSLIEQAFDVGHYAIGFTGGMVLTTTYPAEADAAGLLWFGPGYAVIRKLWVNCATVALVGARVGLGRMFACEIKPCVGSPGTNQWITPPLGLATLNPGQNFHSLRTRQLAPQIVMGSPGQGVGPASAPLSFSGVQYTSKNIGEATFGVKAGVGTDLAPTPLIDTYTGGQPYVLEPAQGIMVQIVYPVAATSQSINYAVNVVWDEWYPMPQTVL
jgi:hypothetical protein